MLNQLNVSTPSDTEIVMTRDFDAPRELVWEAITKPELLRRWMFTPQAWTWAVCDMDVRVGGAFRWAWNGPDGTIALTIWGEHREVSPPARIVHTEYMQMGPGAGPCGGGEAGDGAEIWEMLVTQELTEEMGRTRLTMTLLCPSKEARDAALASGMEHGVAAGYDR
ncbi:MAG TPA: SRPBCC domain-containing protein, partial [Pirellulaceae bacterium]|nr:SRPBCC domain-containing protein [Pirellulaceae bacterium]